MHELQPIGISTIPEISFVGKAEEELTDSSTPFEVGVSPDDGRLLGVHVFGTSATEIVHVGQAITHPAPAGDVPDALGPLREMVMSSSLSSRLMALVKVRPR
jgi:pyruvate/2-oxoglutarate dehydrogenase complex dihydrolipoamide dehydrogenase (E3) component